MSKLFENKYYNQLFGNRQEDEKTEVSEATHERLERIFGGRRQEEGSDSTEASDATENTQARLERIFGGAGKKGMKKGVRNPKPKAAKQTDAQLLASGKFSDEGVDAEGNQQFGFKNGAVAIRDASGRFVIRKGVPADRFAAVVSSKRGARGSVPKKVAKKFPNGQIGVADATKAFSAYWNRKMREAKSYDRVHKLTGTHKRASRVKASKTYHQKYAHKDASHTLSPESPKGYLYLRKERVLRKADGSVSLSPAGKPRVRRAGPAMYDFIGVAPTSLQMRKAAKPATEKQIAARAAFAARSRARVAMSPAEKRQRAAQRSSSRPRAASDVEAIRKRNSTSATKQGAKVARRAEPYPNHQ